MRKFEGLITTVNSLPFLSSSFCLLDEGATSLMWRIKTMTRWIFEQWHLVDQVIVELVHDPHAEFHATLLTTHPFPRFYC